MDFAPHTHRDVEEMLRQIGIEELLELFDAIPDDIRLDEPLDVPSALNEVELSDHMGRLADRNEGAGLICFAGGGAYDHHVPAAVRSLAARAEFATSYTPYQPELSQGVLQAIFEFQSMVCELYGMEVANASLYDGAASVAEAANLAVRVTKREKLVCAGTLHPHYLEVLRTYTSGLGFDVEVVPWAEDGTVEWADADLSGAAAVITPYPNFFGRLEDVERASRLAHDAGALSVVVADPTAMGLLEAPGAKGADVVVGEGYSLGNPTMYGGPYVGLFATKLDLVRQVPGRIAGETLDADGRRAFVLTLQAREQHIRRARATSNVCTNQTLMAIAATVHLAWLGPEGLRRLGELCATRTARTMEVLGAIPDCEIRFTGPVFKEFVLRTPADGTELAKALTRRGFLVGPSLGRWFPHLNDCLLVSVTEKRTEDDIARLGEAIEKALVDL